MMGLRVSSLAHTSSKVLRYCGFLSLHSEFIPSFTLSYYFYFSAFIPHFLPLEETLCVAAVLI